MEIFASLSEHDLSGISLSLLIKAATFYKSVVVIFLKLFNFLVESEKIEKKNR